MRLTRVLLATSAMLAVALAPTAPASAADQFTWPQVQAAAQAAQTNVVRGGGTVTVEVAGKISYRRATDYRPGGAVTRERYREDGMSDSEPDEVTWTIAKKGAEGSYQAMPSLPRTGRYPTLRNASWVRLDPSAAPGITTPDVRLMAFDPLGEISWTPADEAGIIAASWTHGIEGNPSSAVTATFTRTPTGALVLRSYSITDLFPTGPGSAMAVQIDFANPKLVVPDVSFALPEDYVDAAMDAARNTTMAFYTVRNSADSAREKAATMTRPETIEFVRSEVARWEDFSHPPADPTTNIIANQPDGIRLTNRNAYSGQSTVWTISVTQDQQVVVTKRAKPSKVTPIPGDDG